MAITQRAVAVDIIVIRLVHRDDIETIMIGAEAVKVAPITIDAIIVTVLEIDHAIGQEIDHGQKKTNIKKGKYKQQQKYQSDF